MFFTVRKLAQKSASQNIYASHKYSCDAIPEVQKFPSENIDASPRYYSDVIFVAQKSGMLLVEILVALAIITMGISGAVFLVSLNQSTQVYTVRASQAVGLAQKMLVDAHRDAEKQSLYDLTTVSTTSDSFTQQRAVIFETPYRARIDAEVAWNVHGSDSAYSQKIVLSDWISDLTTMSNVVDCPVWHKDWSGGQMIDHTDLNISSLEVVTDGLMYNQYLYLSTDSASTTLPDLYVVDIHDPIHPTVVSSLNTGPGIARLTRHGTYIYAANKGSSQFQIISLVNAVAPTLMGQMKLPGVTVSNGGGIGESIFSLNDTIYIGLTKATGPELHAINVSDPGAPFVVSRAEINSGVSDIFAWHDSVYVSNASHQQLIILNANSLTQKSSFAFDNWQVQSGQQLFVLGKNIYFGRSSGGFSNYAPELIVFDALGTTTVVQASAKLASSIDAIIASEKNIFLLTYDSGASTLVFVDPKSLMVTKTMPLISRSMRLLCDQEYLYSIAAIPSIGFNLFRSE